MILKRLSASSINTFDSSTAFGCERKWWFKYVEGLKEKNTGNQALGTELHGLIEKYLQDGRASTWPAPIGRAYELFNSGLDIIENVSKRKILGLEKALSGYVLEGVPVTGYVDVITSDGIVDWKTTSSIAKYGKKAKDLKHDTQMVIYAHACHPTLETVKLAHGQFQTTGKPLAVLAEIEVTRKELDSHRDNVIIPLVRKMKLVAQEAKASEVTPDRSKCFLCSFKTNCPSESDNIMSFFKASTNPPAPTTAAQTVELLEKSIELTKPIALVAPPDAPESDPELAAKPIEGFEKKSETPTEWWGPTRYGSTLNPRPKPRGRPKGAKNKVEVSVQDEMAINDATHAMREVPSMVTVRSVTVSKGVTLNLGNYNSVRFDVSLTGDGDDFEKTFSKLTSLIQTKLEEEAKKYDEKEV